MHSFYPGAWRNGISAYTHIEPIIGVAREMPDFLFFQMCRILGINQQYRVRENGYLSRAEVRSSMREPLITFSAKSTDPIVSHKQK
jgi:hypothetical protein